MKIKLWHIGYGFLVLMAILIGIIWLIATFNILHECIVWLESFLKLNGMKLP